MKESGRARMTDNEIIKAFECCNNDGCENCPNRPTCCEIDVADEILNIINRQKAEIERLQSMNQAKLDTIHDLMAEVERLQNEGIGNCEMAIAMRSDHNLDVDCNYCIDKAKQEAYKEIVKRLKEHLCSYDLPNYFSFEAVDEDTIDEVLKELVGDKNG